MNSFTTSLYDIRKSMLNFYAKHGRIIQYLFKIAAVFLMQLSISSMTGYFTQLAFPPVMACISLVFCVLPWWMIAVFMSLIILMHLAKISLVVAGVALGFFLVMLFVNLIFAPGNSIVIYFVPVAFFLKIPFLLPVVLGLTASVTAAVPMIFGIMLYYFLNFINSYAGILANAGNGEEEAITVINQLVTVLDGLIANYEMYSVIAAFAITVVVVYLLHRMSLDYSWIMAVAGGIVINLVLVLVTRATMVEESTATMSIPFIVLSSAASLLIAMILQFLLFSADYSHAEKTEFEDDEYYYYVKAVPKVRMSEKEYDKKNIKA